MNLFFYMLGLIVAFISAIAFMYVLAAVFLAALDHYLGINLFKLLLREEIEQNQEE